MNKFGKIALILGVSFGLSATATMPAQAKTTWHRGAPATLRGKWLNTIPRKKDGVAGFATQLKITSSRFFMGESSMPGVFGSKLIWHKSGKVYYMRMHVKQNGFFRGGTWSYRFYRTGSKLYLNPTKNHLKRGYAFKRVAKFRNWY
ncbi:hypothetical protein [Secundilactobacillus folii]|uniref:Extracellular protein n=1 Tax=Secundilactobacillus folii TaxID=2678357 RepID=A0A7X2XYD9_9LACO|nr:hypothetical protein [Secundilactobacillus folii]MTV83188.1 hypothetical protein [Secundilactobacillus folii]